MFSDHGATIDALIEKIDSEILAKLIREQLKKLPSQRRRALLDYYGDCFGKEKLLSSQIAEKEKVSRQTIHHWVTRCCAFLLRPKTTLAIYIRSEPELYALFKASKYGKMKPSKFPVEKGRRKRVNKKVQKRENRKKYIQQSYEKWARHAKTVQLEWEIPGIPESGNTTEKVTIKRERKPTQYIYTDENGVNRRRKRPPKKIPGLFPDTPQLGHDPKLNHIYEILRKMREEQE